LACLQDPLNPYFELVGSPASIKDEGDVWALSFLLPKGYSGPGYKVWVSKRSLLPIKLVRGGEGLPDLEIDYDFKVLSHSIARVVPRRRVKPLGESSLGVAFERSRFRPLLEHALSVH